MLRSFCVFLAAVMCTTSPVASLKPGLGYTRLYAESGAMPSCGQTGAYLDIDTAKCAYYALLDIDERRLYRQIVANAYAYIEDFEPVVPLYERQIHDVFFAVFADYPEIYWLDTRYTAGYDDEDICRQLGLVFNKAAGDVEAYADEMDRKLTAILDDARSRTSDEERERFVHDLLINQVRYDEHAVMGQSCYSAVVLGSTVCAGYAKAFQYIMQQLGIPCYYVSGSALAVEQGSRWVSHAWNLVKLGDGWYNVDITWDDSMSTNDYYNRSDEYFNYTHMREELSVHLPQCNTDFTR